MTGILEDIETTATLGGDGFIGVGFEMTLTGFFLITFGWIVLG